MDGIASHSRQVSTNLGCDGRRRARHRRTVAIGLSILAMSLLGATVGVVGGASTVSAASTPADASAAQDALDEVNLIRTLSGLNPVELDGSLTAPATAHACWMAINDTIAHSETPGSPGYSAAGNASAQRSNVAISSTTATTAKDFVDLWITGPYHALGILENDLKRTGFGQCRDDAGQWRNAAALDVQGGLGAPTAAPVVTFPGNQSVVPWTRFIAESPNPLENCSSNGSEWVTAGLPLLALGSEAPSQSTTATLIGPNNAPLETCVVTQHNDVSSLGKSILAGHHAVIVLPRYELANGHYSVTVQTGSEEIAWQFDVGPGVAKLVSTAAAIPAPSVAAGAPSATFVSAPLERILDTRSGAGRLVSGQEYNLPLGTPPAGATAVAVTVTAPGSDPSGWLAVYPCGAWAGTSSLNFAAGRTGATTVIASLGAKGVCVRSEGYTHLVADVSGWMVAGESGGRFVTAEARRFDSRRSGQRLSAGEVTRIHVADPGTAAVALNVTTVNALDAGFTTVWPCASASEARPNTSLGQSRPGAAQATFGIVPVAADGALCVYTSSPSDVIVDTSGSFVQGAGAAYVAFAPVRRFDTRQPQAWASPATPGVRLTPTSEIGFRLGVDGLPANVVGLLGNVTVTHTAGDGWIGVNQCGVSGGTSDVNFVTGDTVANMSIVATDAGQNACLALSTTAHLVLDLYGAFVE